MYGGIFRLMAISIFVLTRGQSYPSAILHQLEACSQAEYLITLGSSISIP